MMLQLNDEYLWDYHIEAIRCVDVVVEVVRCCWLSCWVHAYSYKVGGACPVEY